MLQKRAKTPQKPPGIGGILQKKFKKWQYFFKKRIVQRI